MPLRSFGIQKSANVVYNVYKRHSPHAFRMMFGAMYPKLERIMQTAEFVVTLFDGKSNPNKVTVAYTMALNAVKAGHSAILLLMVDAVELGKPGALEGINIGAPFEPAADLLKEYLAAGGRIGVCKACMAHNGFTAEEMVPEYEIVTAPDVVTLLMASNGSLQLT